MAQTPEERRAYRRVWYAVNKDRMRILRKRKAEVTKRAALWKKWYSKNKHKRRAYSARWRAAHPEYQKAYYHSNSGIWRRCYSRRKQSAYKTEKVWRKRNLPKMKLMRKNYHQRNPGASYARKLFGTYNLPPLLKEIVNLRAQFNRVSRQNPDAIIS